MRLIDATKLIQLLCVNMDSGEQFDKATHCVDVMPTVDAVPVIRCRECKHYKWNDCFAEITREDGKKYYVSYIDSPKPDDYCSRAERKEES